MHVFCLKRERERERERERDAATGKTQPALAFEELIEEYIFNLRFLLLMIQRRGFNERETESDNVDIYNLLYYTNYI